MSAPPRPLTEAQSDWFIREVKRCRAIGMPLGCCDDWPECDHVLRWLDRHKPTPDHFEGNLAANIAGGRHETLEMRECEHRWREHEGIGWICRDCGTSRSAAVPEERE